MTNPNEGVQHDPKAGGESGFTPQEHRLKTLPDFYRAVESGDKCFEVRKDDRGFQRGDILVLQKWTPDDGYSFTYGPGGRFADPIYHEQRRRITYILTGAQFGIEPGYVVMGLAPVEQAGRKDGSSKPKTPGAHNA